MLEDDKLDDPLFGQLQWDPETDWWEGSVPTANGESFNLSVQPRSPVDRSITEKTRGIYRQHCRELDHIREEALREFYSRTRDQHGYEDLTLEQLFEHLRPDGIMVRSDGYLEVGFADRQEKVFGGGHIIVSRFWPSGTREVVLEG